MAIFSVAVYVGFSPSNPLYSTDSFALLAVLDQGIERLQPVVLQNAEVLLLRPE